MFQLRRTFLRFASYSCYPLLNKMQVLPFGILLCEGAIASDVSRTGHCNLSGAQLPLDRQQVTPCPSRQARVAEQKQCLPRQGRGAIIPSYRRFGPRTDRSVPRKSCYRNPSPKLQSDNCHQDSLIRPFEPYLLTHLTADDGPDGQELWKLINKDLVSNSLCRNCV